MCDFRYTLREKIVLGILKPIFTENEIEEWSELPRRGSTTLETSVYTVICLDTTDQVQTINFFQPGFVI